MATCGTSQCDSEVTDKFHDLGLDDWLTDQCKAMGLKKPTPIQQNCIPHILLGRDIFCLSVSHSEERFRESQPITTLAYIQFKCITISINNRNFKFEFLTIKCIE